MKLHHKRLSPARLRAAVHDAIGRRPGAERVARGFKDAGGAPAAAAAVEELLGEHAAGRRITSSRLPEPAGLENTR